MLPDGVTADEPKTEMERRIREIGNALAQLDPGALASLRRASSDGMAPPMFWRLLSRLDLPKHDEQIWLRIIQMMAILTDKGATTKLNGTEKRSPHDGGFRLGTTLCDGAAIDWGQGELKPRPMLSEARLARLLAATGSTRYDLMEQTVRALAAKKPRGVGVNCEDFARFLLQPNSAKPGQDLARSYYARLDRAQRNSATTETVAGDDE